jgi:hypothetical protein
MGWYSVRCVFRLGDQPDYEERITLWRAASFNEAIALAEAEGQEYAASTGFQYLGLSQAFDLKTDSLPSGTEAFSLIRTSSLQPGDYLNRFFDTGSERQGSLE